MKELVVKESRTAAGKNGAAAKAWKNAALPFSLPQQGIGNREGTAAAPFCHALAAVCDTLFQSILPYL